MIEYSLPGFTTRLSYNLMVVDAMRQSPELFFDDISISGFYDCFPGCIMNGGRHISGSQYTYDEMADTFDQINNAGMTARLTFTNMLIQPEHFNDDYANMILKAAQGRNVEIVVYSDELGDYISGKYHLKLILSTTRQLNSVEELNRMLNRYDMVVLDYNHNKDDAFLEKVSDPARLIVMPNELCILNCPYRQRHYESHSLDQLNHVTIPTFDCMNANKNGLGPLSDQPNAILNNDDIRRLNSTYGITHFKIVGRTAVPKKSIDTYLYYLVRPEYRSAMRKILQKKLKE